MTRTGWWGGSLLAKFIFVMPVVVLGKVDAAAPASSKPEPSARHHIRWIQSPPPSLVVTVEASGLDQESLRQFERSQPVPDRWRELLAVRVEQGDLFTEVGLPPMLGDYRVDGGTLRFKPRFEFTRGVSYRAILHPDVLKGKSTAQSRPVTSLYKLADVPSSPTTVVSQVYPGADVLPENLLKFYVHFSAPMSGGHIYDHIHLRNEAGKDVELPFLEIDEELWDASMTRLTLFIDPGRIKREVQPLEEIGPALEEGKSFTLVIDREWRDASATPLKEDFQKSFKVGPPNRNPVDPRRWRIQPPKAGTTDPLRVTFPTPMDHALAQRMIRAVDDSGKALPGRVELADQERLWSFVPARSWSRGGHALIVQTTIEDLAGNNVGKAFEVDVFEGIARRLTNSSVRLPFDLQ